MTNLHSHLKAVNGATFISIDTETQVKLTGGKKNPLQGHITKKVTGSQVMVFENKNSNGYENMVNRRLEKEGKRPFTLSARKWGTRVEGFPIVTHKDNEYLEVIFLRKGVTTFFQDGQLITKDVFEDTLPPTYQPSQGDVEDKVIIRTFNLDSVQAIRINKTELKGPFTFVA